MRLEPVLLYHFDSGGWPKPGSVTAVVLAHVHERVHGVHIDENRDDGIAKIKLMVSRAQSQATMAKTMTDILLKVKKEGRDTKEDKEDKRRQKRNKGRQKRDKK